MIRDIAQACNVSPLFATRGVLTFPDALVVRADNFVGLDELGYGGTDDIVLGGRLDLAVDVARMIGGQPIQGGKIVVQAIMTSQPENGAELIFYVRRAPRGVYEAVNWRFADEDVGSRFGMCASP